MQPDGILETVIYAPDLEAAERSYATSQRLGMGVVVAVAALFLGIPELLMRIFTEDPEGNTVELVAARPGGTA